MRGGCLLTAGMVAERGEATSTNLSAAAFSRYLAAYLRLHLSSYSLSNQRHHVGYTK